MSQDNLKTISQSARHFFSGTMLSRMTGLGREVLMAAIFGATPQVAAFWMAFRFANLLRRMLGEGALNAAFIPQFEKLRSSREDEAAHFFHSLSRGLGGLLLIILLLSELTLGSVLWFGNVSNANREVIELTLIMLPALFFISLYGLNSALLNCERSFFIPSVAPAAFNLIWIAAIYFLWNQETAFAMRILAGSVVVAFFAQWLMTLPQVFRYKCRSLNNKKSRDFKQLFALLRPVALGIIGVTATQINTALDSIFARIADDRGPAILWYAIRLQQLPLGLLGVGLTGALLPPIVRAIQAQDFTRYFQFLNFSYRRTFIFMIPITAFLLATSLSLVNVVYGRGEFSAADVHETARCLQAYSLGIVPMTFVLIFASAFYALQNYAVPTALSLMAMALNCLLNAYFVYVLGWGAISIAVATSISAVCNSVLLGFFLAKEKRLFEGSKEFWSLIRLFFKVALSSLVAGGLTVVISHACFPSLSRQFFAESLLFLQEAGVFTVSFIALAYAFKIEEIKSLLFQKLKFSRQPNQ